RSWWPREHADAVNRPGRAGPSPVGAPIRAPRPAATRPIAAGTGGWITEADTMACMPVPGDQSHVIDRRAGANGELLLRRAGDHLEIISNGVFLMDTRNGESERLLARAALDATGRPAR